MKHIYQRYSDDCFPTCVAMIAGISHKEAVKLVHPNRQKYSPYATLDSDGISALRKLGYKVRIRKNIDFTKLKQFAIVYTFEKEMSHVSVWDPIQKRIFDPSYKYRGWDREDLLYYKWYCYKVAIIT